MTIASELINVLGYRLEGEHNLRRFNEGMDDADDRSKRLGAGFRAAGGAMLAAGGAMLAAGTMAARASAQHERAMGRIAVTAGATEAEMGLLEASIRNVAARYGKSFDEVRDGADALIASGRSVAETVTMLDPIAATAQASGSQITDLVGVVSTLGETMKLTAGETEGLLDILNTGGKLGSFELKDMASYLPQISTNMSALGYEGLEGSKDATAWAQVVRARSANASQADTQIRGVLNSIYSNETANSFKKASVDIRARLRDRQAAGEDVILAYLDELEKVTAGDLSRLPEFIGDQEARSGAANMLAGRADFATMRAQLDEDDVFGSVSRDVAQFADDAESAFQRVGDGWNRMVASIGESLAAGGIIDGLASGMTNAAEAFDRRNAINRGAEIEGVSAWQRFRSSDEELDRLARVGDYVDSRDRSSIEAASRFPEAYKEHGGDLMRPMIPEGPRISVPVDHRATGLPTQEDVVRQQFGDRRRETLAAAIQGPLAIEPPASPLPATLVDAPSWWSSTMPTWLGGGDTPAVTDNSEAAMAEVAGHLATSNARLADMTMSTPTTVDAVVTDARQDNRAFPVNTTVNVGGVSVQQPAAAPAAVGAAVGNAAASAVNSQASRINTEPSF